MEAGKIEFAPDYESPTFTAFDGWQGSFVEVFERNDAEIKRRLAQMSGDSRTASKHARLEREVVNTAKAYIGYQVIGTRIALRDAVKALESFEAEQNK